MLSIFRRRTDDNLAQSKLFDEQTFYPVFMKDIDKCRRELIIECPFMAHKRMNALYPSFRRLTKRGVRVVINTRDSVEHDSPMDNMTSDVIAELQTIGVAVLFTGNHHRKLAIIDGRVLYEGSLNILSQNDSCEIMRRIESEELAMQMISFVKLDKFLGKLSF